MTAKISADKQLKNPVPGSFLPVSDGRAGVLQENLPKSSDRVSGSGSDRGSDRGSGRDRVGHVTDDSQDGCRYTIKTAAV